MILWRDCWTRCLEANRPEAHSSIFLKAKRNQPLSIAPQGKPSDTDPWFVYSCRFPEKSIKTIVWKLEPFTVRPVVSTHNHAIPEQEYQRSAQPLIFILFPQIARILPFPAHAILCPIQVGLPLDHVQFSQSHLDLMSQSRRNQPGHVQCSCSHSKSGQNRAERANRFYPNDFSAISKVTD